MRFERLMDIDCKLNALQQTNFDYFNYICTAVDKGYADIVCRRAMGEAIKWQEMYPVYFVLPVFTNNSYPVFREICIAYSAEGFPVFSIWIN
jgi:hypothetical protein